MSLVMFVTSLLRLYHIDDCIWKRERVRPVFSHINRQVCIIVDSMIILYHCNCCRCYVTMQCNRWQPIRYCSHILINPYNIHLSTIYTDKHWLARAVAPTRLYIPDKQTCAVQWLLCILTTDIPLTVASMHRFELRDRERERQTEKKQQCKFWKVVVEVVVFLLFVCVCRNKNNNNTRLTGRNWPTGSSPISLSSAGGGGGIFLFFS